MFSTLIHAIEQGNINIVKFLLEREVSLASLVMRENSEFESSALLTTGVKNKIDILKMLLAYGANVKVIDNKGRSLLHHVAKTMRNNSNSELIDFSFD